MLRTDWFPVSIKPVRVGVYEVKTPSASSCNTHTYWNGVFFSACSSSVYLATQNTDLSSTYMLREDSMWRGLAEDPNA